MVQTLIAKINSLAIAANAKAREEEIEYKI